MMVNQTIKKHLINIRGSRLDSRVVVFESDDWGSIRIPNNEVKQQLLDKELIKDRDSFSKYDALETSDDYFALYNVFKKFKDVKGNHPILTANMIMNNPDFAKIEAGNFEKYYCESFLETYLNYPGSNDAFKALQIGIKQGMLMPQFHGHEHLNVTRWMKLLKQGDERYHYAFARKCFSIDEVSSDNRRSNLMAAYDYNSEDELEYIQTSITNGLQQFEQLFGLNSKTTVAPCYVWDSKVEKVFQKNEVETFQGSYLQNYPIPGQMFKRKYHYSGQLNSDGQSYLVRNGLFEPSIIESADWVSKCMESISIAFKWGKPAIIGTHRINFCSRLDETKRAKNLSDLEVLLSQMLKRWPNIEFLDSATLSNIYNN